MPDISPRTLPRDQLVPWPDLNPRKRFPDDEMEELRASLEEDGMLLPLGVKLNPEPPHYVFAGERRWRASEGILDQVPVTIRDIDLAVARRLALTENIQREQLTPMEEAWGIKAYMDAAPDHTQTAVGQELGKSQGWVSNRLRLLRLPDEIQVLVQTEFITATQARDLILRFSVLPDEQWEELAGAVATRLVKLDQKRKGKPLTDDEVRNEVKPVAVAMSGFVDQPLWNREPWLDRIAPQHHGRLHAYTWTKEQRKAAPRGTVVQYAYGFGTHESKRCFDPELWEDNVLARIQEHMEEREKEEAAAEGEPRANDLEWSPELGAIPADTKIDWNQRHLVMRLEKTGGEIGPRLYVDPTEIEAGHLVLREGGPPRPKHDWQPEILCTSEEEHERAKESYRAKIDGMHDRLFARAMEAEARASEGIDLANELPLVVAAANSRTGHYDPLIRVVAHDMELSLPVGERELAVALDDMEEEQRTELLRRMVWRFVEEDLNPSVRTRHEAVEKVRAMLLEELAGKIEIPTPYVEEEKDDADE